MLLQAELRCRRRDTGGDVVEQSIEWDASALYDFARSTQRFDQIERQVAVPLVSVFVSRLVGSRGCKNKAPVACDLRQLCLGGSQVARLDVDLQYLGPEPAREAAIEKED